MKYKTARESNKGISIVGLIVGIIGIFSFVMCMSTGFDRTFAQVDLYMGCVGIGSFIYCWTCNCKRNRFRKNGKKYNATIVGAEGLLSARGEDTYYLIISFQENGEQKFRYTEGYQGDPNYKLKNISCAVYKWKGKYIEADFNVLDKKEKPHYLGIPISKHKHFKRKKMKYV